MQFYYSFTETPEGVFNITTDEGDSFFVKSAYPRIKDFKPENIHEWGNFFCQLFAEKQKTNGSDIRGIVYEVWLDMCYKYGMTCQVWSDALRLQERERIGAKLKELRIKKKMEAKQLAALTGFDASNISKIEQGRYSVGFDILAKIALALGASLDLVPLDKEEHKNE